MNDQLITVSKQIKRALPRGEAVVAAESLTAGMVQSALASVSGSSAYFLGGLTVYTLEQKVKLLKVNRTHAQRVNCVSPRVAYEMARGAQKLFGATYGIATTGYAEPWPEKGIMTPFAYYSVRTPTGSSWDGRVEFEKVLSRNEMREAVALAALNSFLHVLDVLNTKG